MADTASELPKPGQVVHLDFRQPAAAQQTSEQASAQHTPNATTASQTNITGRNSTKNSRPLRLVQWNIERGYELPLVIQQLRELEADVVSLQEVR